MMNPSGKESLLAVTTKGKLYSPLHVVSGLKLCPTSCYPMDCISPSGSLVHGMLQNSELGCQARLQGIFQHRDRTQVFCISCIADKFFTAEPRGLPHSPLHIFYVNIGFSTIYYPFK